MNIDYEVWVRYGVDMEHTDEMGKVLVPAGVWIPMATVGGADDAVRILRTWVLDPKTISARIDVIVS